MMKVKIANLLKSIDQGLAPFQKLVLISLAFWATHIFLGVVAAGIAGHASPKAKAVVAKVATDFTRYSTVPFCS